MKLYLRVIAFFVFNAVLFFPLAGRAYITSATLEYSVDDQAHFWINGHPLNSPQPHVFDFAVLSTSDGTLPLEVFNFNGDNVLAVEDQDLGGGGMFISFRLTVHHSTGDPVVVWSDPAQCRMLHLSKEQPSPAAWFSNNFDDHTWTRPQQVLFETGSAVFAELSDPAFGGLLGLKGHVPVLSHDHSGLVGHPRDHDLYRSHFRFPYSPAKTALLAQPTQVSQGQSVAFRLVPGADSADLGNFNVYSILPTGLNPAQISAGGHWDSARRLLWWPYPSGAAYLSYLHLPFSAVLQADSWIQAEKALGPEKQAPYNPANCAAFLPGSPAWFSIQAPSQQEISSHPSILGVIFHAAFNIGVSDLSHGSSKLDTIYFNYALGSGRQKALADDVKVSRVANGGTWFDAYYDASEDRRWTWQDLSNLKVYYQSVQRNHPQKTLLAWGGVVVKCFNPYNLSPVFSASLQEADCKSLKVWAGLSNPRFTAPAPDFVEISANPQRCASPTPMPALQGPSKPAGNTLLSGLGCLQSSPEPFKRGGVFVYFCLKAQAQVALNIYGSSGALLRALPPLEFRPGNNQIFFNGNDEHGRPLSPGAYVYELKASTASSSQSSRASFHKVEESAE